MSYRYYKFRLYPNQQQEAILIQWLGCGRWVWNKMLEHNISRYNEEKKFSFHIDMNNMLPSLKKSFEWLSDAPSQILQQKCQSLSGAIQSVWKSGFGFPKFKSKHLDTSGIRFPQGWHLDGNRLNLPKLKGIKIKLHREIKGKMTACVVSKDRCGDWWVSVMVSLDNPKLTLEINNAVGIDVGLKSFVVTSDGDVITNPKFLSKSLDKLKRKQQSLARKQKGSNNRNKASLIVSRLHRKISNKRKDFINQVSSSIAKMYDLVCVENLNVFDMLKNRYLSKSISDVSWSAFISILEWHCMKRGKHFHKIGRFDASTKTCSTCGSKQPMPLECRVFQCSSCGLEIDRDFNAALNILNFGLKNMVGMTKINACGDMMFGRTSAQEALLF